MSEIIRTVLAVLGALGGVTTFVFMLIWRMKQKNEDLEHALIRSELQRAVDKITEQGSNLKHYIELNNQNVLELERTKQSQAQMKETVDELKETVGEFRQVVQELSLSLARFTGRD